MDEQEPVRNEVATGASRPDEPVTPALKIVSPDATPEEIAAIVAVISAMGSQGSATPEKKPTTWNAPYRQVRVHYSAGPGGWRASAMPNHRGR